MSNPHKRRRLDTPEPSESPDEHLINTFNKVEPLLHELLTASQSIPNLSSILGAHRATFIQALRRMIPSPPNPPHAQPWPPQLPIITNPALRTAALSPRSAHNFQRMEFLGDSYLQMISSQLLYERFPLSREGPLSIMRSQLVANIPLSEYARAYNFESRINGSSGWKVLADSFEAYVAGVALSDPVCGVQTLTDWLAALYEPKMVRMAAEMEAKLRKTGRRVKQVPTLFSEEDEWEEWDDEVMKEVSSTLDKGARNSLRFLVAGDGATLKYVPLESEDGFEIVVLLSGWGFRQDPIGQGWGETEEDACIRAAMNALADRPFCEEIRRLKAAYQESIQLPPPPPPPPPPPVKPEPLASEWREVDGVIVLDD